jgi:two-component system chemotaxis response regulator CheB
MNHDIVTIGGSAGSIEVLLDFASKLPRGLPAAILIAIHSAAESPGLLPELLTNRGPLPATHPIHGDRIQNGHIYVAPPDNNLLVRDGTMAVVRGPRENGHRPAVDALFRTASASYGPRVIGVVLSGFLDCGTAGLMSIKSRGGLGVAQDPASAFASQMPRSAIDRGSVDHVVKASELAGLVTRLVESEAGPALTPDAFVAELEAQRAGKPVELVCPACKGVLQETAKGSFHHFRCHTGHAFSLKGLIAEQAEEMERALWSAVRSLEEGAAFSRRLRAIESGEVAVRFGEKAAQQKHDAEIIKKMLLRGSELRRADANDAE